MPESAADTLKLIHKNFGKHVGGFADTVRDAPRVPTGIFSLDVATGGGIPFARSTLVHGPESSGKTALVLKLIAFTQALYPDQKVALIDVEGTTDRAFAEMWGVDWDKLIHLCPEYGEQAVDMVQMLLMAEDVILVCLDSVAMLTQMGEVEIESEAEKSAVGKPGLLGRKLFSKATHAINHAARKQSRYPAFVAINQPRYKIGVMFGNPETLPGGDNQKFVASLRLRLWGKAKVESNLHPTRPARLQVEGRIVKKKVPVVADGFKYMLALQPHKQLVPGQADNRKAILTHLTETGLLHKRGQGKYVCCKRVFSTQQGVVDKMTADPSYYQRVVQAVVAKLEQAG